MTDDQSSGPPAPPPGGLLPPPFMSSRKSWVASTSSPVLIDDEGYQQGQRIGFHPLIGSSAKGQIVSHVNGTSNATTTATKVPISDVPALPVLNLLVAAYLILIGE